MIGPAARVLRALAAVDPLYFSSFYRRARLYAERPAAGVATVTLDLTTRCPLRCGFCFAAGTQDSGREFSLGEVQALADQLRGLDKLVLIGGEPLAHPQTRAVLDVVGAAHDAVEIYTNGLPIPLDADRRDAWLRDRLAGRRAHFTLTLAVDADHKAEIGAVEFARRLDGMLAASRQFPWLGVRFNVTDARLHTTGYLAPETVVAVLSDLHPPLVTAFRTALASGNLVEHFQFNPVVRLGRAADSTGERLKAEDALFSPEVVISKNDTGLAALRMLPAAWMTAPPTPLVRSLRGPEELAATLRAKWVADHLDADQYPDALRQFDQLAAGHGSADLAAQLRWQALGGWLQDWPTRRNAWMDRTAAHLDGLVAEPGVAWDLSADRRIRRLTVPILRRFAALRWQRTPQLQTRTIETLAARATEWLARGQVPMFAGYQPRPGLLADAPDEALPLDQTPLDVSPRPPHLGDALLRPQVVPHVSLGADGCLDVALDGVGGVPFSSARTADSVAAGYAHVVGMLAWLVPQAAAAELMTACRARIAALRADAKSPQWAAVLEACARAEPRGVPVDSPESPADALKLLAGDAAGHFERVPQFAAPLSG